MRIKLGGHLPVTPVLSLRCVYHSLFFLFFSFHFLGPHPQHMEVPRLGDESELQLLAYATATANVGSKPPLPPILQLTAALDPEPSDRGQGLNPHHYGY